MSVYELSREQLTELKQSYFCEYINPNISYGEMAAIDDIISDDEVFAAYENTDFDNDDFGVTAGL